MLLPGLPVKGIPLKVSFLEEYYHDDVIKLKTFAALLSICAGNSPVPGEFPAQRPVTRSFDVFFDLPLNKRLSKQSWGWWFETLSRPLWRHCNDVFNWPGHSDTNWQSGNERGRHWFSYWLEACFIPVHYLNKGKRASKSGLCVKTSKHYSTWRPFIRGNSFECFINYISNSNVLNGYIYITFFYPIFIILYPGPWW